MAKLQMLSAFGLAAMAAIFTIGIEAQAGDPATLIQQKLVSQIKLTKSAADHSDIVTAGDVVVLHKDGLMMCSSVSSYAFSNTYSNGVLTANQKNRAKDAAKSFGRGFIPIIGGGGSAADAANNGCASRKFVAGEKFWVTGVTPKKTASSSAPSAIPTRTLRETRSVTTGRSSSPSQRVLCRRQTILSRQFQRS